MLSLFIHLVDIYTEHRDQETRTLNIKALIFSIINFIITTDCSQGALIALWFLIGEILSVFYFCWTAAVSVVFLTDRSFPTFEVSARPFSARPFFSYLLRSSSFT